MSKYLEIPSRASVMTAEAAVAALALEALSPMQGVQNIFELFRNVFPTVKTKLMDAVNSFHPLDEHSHEIQLLNKNAAEAKPDILKLGIVTYGQTLLPVPEGLANGVKLLKYLTFLLDVSDTFNKGVNDILSEYKIVVSTFISNKEAKTSIKDHSLFYRGIEKRRLELTKALSSYFTTGLNRARLPLEMVYDQTKDVYEAVDLVNKLHKARGRADLPGVKKQSEHCADLLNIIIEQSEQGTLTNISGAAATDLANGAMEVARWIELLTVYHFRLDQGIGNVRQQVELLSRFRD